MPQQQPIRNRAAGSDIPDKLYFRIGEVARLCDVPAYVLRFWESEFPQLRPNKGGTGQRLYRRRDVETARRIKTLLYDEGYTIPGARQAIKQELRNKEPMLPLTLLDAPPVADVQSLRKLQKELRDMHAMLSRPPGRAAVHPFRAPRAGSRTRQLQPPERPPIL
ncbi:MAG: MerR family transcriptional regulator [Acidobacteriota bacterium]|nr:MerR family transcriptional regulator [Acidobacteriota bacterium]